MMSRFLLTAGILASSVLSPLTAHAYLPPEDVLNDDDFSATYYSPPPSQREIDAVMEAQRERSAARREAEQAALQKEGEDPEDDELHSAADDEEEDDDEAASDLEALIEALQGLQEDDDDLHGAAGEEEEDNTSALTTEELREQRLLERIRQQQLDAQRAAQYGWMTAGLGAGETLHSGAPLSETGPATVLIVLAIAGAIGETWRRVRKAERK